MSEEFLGLLERATSIHQEAGVGMAQVMDPQLRQTDVDPGRAACIYILHFDADMEDKDNGVIDVIRGIAERDVSSSFWRA